MLFNNSLFNLQGLALPLELCCKEPAPMKSRSFTPCGSQVCILTYMASLTQKNCPLSFELPFFLTFSDLSKLAGTTLMVLGTTSPVPASQPLQCQTSGTLGCREWVWNKEWKEEANVQINAEKETAHHQGLPQSPSSCGPSGWGLRRRSLGVLFWTYYWRKHTSLFDITLLQNWVSFLINVLLLKQYNLM